MIEADGVGKEFGDVVAVADLTFDVQRGEVVGLLGANGAGKTTTMKMLLGLLSPTSGSVSFDGRRLADVDRRLFGYVPQGLGLYPDLTVMENLQFAAAAFGAEVPELGDLAAVADRRVGQVPLGTRRRVAFLAARCHDPDVLILDEPTSGVGPLGRARLWQTIHEAADKGSAVLVSTHYMEEADECDRVLLMSGGREVVSGRVGDIVGAFTSVVVEGELDDPSMNVITANGGTILADGHGWRVVGMDAIDVRRALGPGAVVSEVPARFEEVFVSLSR